MYRRILRESKKKVYETANFRPFQFFTCFSPMCMKSNFLWKICSKKQISHGKLVRKSRFPMENLFKKNPMENVYEIGVCFENFKRRIFFCRIVANKSSWMEHHFCDFCFCLSILRAFRKDNKQPFSSIMKSCQLNGRLSHSQFNEVRQ